jgi:membrane protein
MRLMGVSMPAMVVVWMLTGVASQSRMMLMVLTATVLSVVLMLSLAGIGLTVMRPRGTSVFVTPMGAARTLMVPSVIGLLMVMALTLVETRRTLMRFRVVTVPTRVMVTGLMRTLTVTLSLARTTPMPLTAPSMMRLAVMVTQMLSLVMVSRMVTVLGRILTRNR